MVGAYRVRIGLAGLLSVSLGSDHVFSSSANHGSSGTLVQLGQSLQQPFLDQAQDQITSSVNHSLDGRSAGLLSIPVITSQASSTGHVGAAAFTSRPVSTVNQNQMVSLSSPNLSVRKPTNSPSRGTGNRSGALVADTKLGSMTGQSIGLLGDSPTSHDSLKRMPSLTNSRTPTMPPSKSIKIRQTQRFS
ncbi:unnamed protein product [Protopolystoma xenopodis]|uniref:Uncharacterized protein n=1 Tax=Protopolystoma xenopodis TaxID=117903 RepID=A0A3S5AYS3_9PLAT|nr:unnamed protein product [Protopolystoma xenopodis]